MEYAHNANTDTILIVEADFVQKLVINAKHGIVQTVNALPVIAAMILYPEHVLFLEAIQDQIKIAKHLTQTTLVHNAISDIM